MTIKSQGGIFGRNPSFANVTTDELTSTNINVTNKLGVGTSTPAVEFEIATSAPQMRITDTDTSATFQINASSVSGSVELQADATNVGSNPAMIFDVGGAEKLRILDGGGITFNGDTAAANALDDYEEGTWTPVFADAASGGNTSASVFSGDYTKVGNLVFVNCSLVDIDTTGLTAGNDLYIQGLPFTPKSGTLFAGSVFGRVTISGKWCTAAISTSAAIRLEDNPGTTANPSRVPVSGIVDDGGDLRISITYIEA